MAGITTETLNVVLIAATIPMMIITLHAKTTDSAVAVMTGAGMRSHSALTGLLTPTMSYLNTIVTSKSGMSVSMAQQSCPGTALTAALNKALSIASLRICTNTTTNLLQQQLKRRTKWKSCIV